MFPTSYIFFRNSMETLTTRHFYSILKKGSLGYEITKQCIKLG